MLWLHSKVYKRQSRETRLLLVVSLPPTLLASVLQIGSSTLSHQASSAICKEHHLLCTLQFTGVSSAREQMHWCTKIHLFETISKWQLLYRRNIEIKMKQNITDDACIVDFCALKNITMLFALWNIKKTRISFIFQVWIPLERPGAQQCNEAFRISDETAISSDQKGDQINNEEIQTRSFFYWWWLQQICADIK